MAESKQEQREQAADEEPRDVPEAEAQATDEALVDDDSPEALRAQRDEYLARWQRAQADFQNLRRRAAADLEAGLRRSMMPLLEGLLIVMDQLDMALSTPVETDEAKNLAVGVRMTRDQFMQSLAQEGVEVIDETAEFDPALHEAVAAVDSPGAEPGSIVATVRRGYRWHGQVLRHAHVKVAKAAEVDEE